MRWSASPVPADVRAALAMPPGERLLAGAVDASGRWHIGTQTALYVGGEHGARAIPWERVDRALWDRDAGTLTVVEVADFGEPEPRTDLHLTEPGRFLELVRERITASVLLTHRVRVDGESGGVTVIARRSPARTGDVTFAYLIDRGLDPASPAVSLAGQRGVDVVRAELGL